MKFRASFLDGIGIALLFTLAVVQPLFDLLRRNPEFFVARQSRGLDIILLVFVLCILIPFLLMAINWLLHRLSPTAGNIFHHTFFLVFLALLAIPILKRTGYMTGSTIVPVSILIAVMLLLVFRRYEVARASLKLLSFLIPVVPLLFLSGKSISGLLTADEPLPANPRISSTAPIVFMILDEFPLVSLLDSDGKIDAERFPNFARLQRDSVWFRNATTVADATPESVSGILSGRYPLQGHIPVLKSYPNNLFTLLAGSYEIKALEHVSKLAPRSSVILEENHSWIDRLNLMLLDLSAIYLHIVVPNELRPNLPDINQTWGNFWSQDAENNPTAKFKQPYAARAEEFQAFLKMITPSKEPTLYFHHVFLPHVPWAFLPSGKEYDYRGYGPMGVEGLSVVEEIWTTDEWVVYRGYQRHLLQVCYVDRMIGKLIDHLKAQKLYDSTMIVITADHGSSFHPGDRARTLTQSNYGDILSIPVFMKRPGMAEGKIIDKDFETIDILPTMADTLGLELPFQTDGGSTFQQGTGRGKKRVLKTIFGRDEWFEFESEDIVRQRNASVRRKIQLFGIGDPQALYNPFIPREGQELQVQDLNWSDGGGVHFELKNPAAFENVDLTSNFIPVFIAGRALFHKSPPEPVVIGVWVNGLFRGFTRTFPPDKNVKGWLRTLWLRSSAGNATANLEDIHGFGIIVPESSFRQGRNDVQIKKLALSQK